MAIASLLLIAAAIVAMVLAFLIGGGFALWAERRTATGRPL